MPMIFGRNVVSKRIKKKPRRVGGAPQSKVQPRPVPTMLSRELIRELKRNNPRLTVLFDKMDPKKRASKPELKK